MEDKRCYISPTLSIDRLEVENGIAASGFDQSGIDTYIFEEYEKE